MDWLFSSWEALGRTLAVSAAMYLGAVAVIRVSGKRTMSKWNAFDSVVTVAMGSSLATAILSRQTSLAQGLVAFAALVGLQFVLTWTTLRVRLVERLVKSNPTVLLVDGRVCHEALRRERVAETELHAAVRSQGLAALDELAAVVLETDGTISVVPKGDRPAAELWALRGLLDRDAAAGQGQAPPGSEGPAGGGGPAPPLRPQR